MGARQWTKLDQLVERIHALPEAARTALALGCAQRLMNHHLSLPPAQRDPFTEALAPDLTLLWERFRFQARRRTQPFGSY